MSMDWRALVLTQAAQKDALKAEIAEKGKRIEELEWHIAAKDERITQLTLRETDSLNDWMSLRRTLVDKETRIEELEAQIAEKEKKFSDLDALVAYYLALS